METKIIVYNNESVIVDQNFDYSFKFPKEITVQDIPDSNGIQILMIPRINTLNVKFDYILNFIKEYNYIRYVVVDSVSEITYFVLGNLIRAHKNIISCYNINSYKSGYLPIMFDTIDDSLRFSLEETKLSEKLKEYFEPKRIFPNVSFSNYIIGLSRRSDQQYLAKFTMRGEVIISFSNYNIILKVYLRKDRKSIKGVYLLKYPLKVDQNLLDLITRELKNIGYYIEN